MRVAVVALCLLFAVPQAVAWTAGPYTFERCVDTFDVAVRGTVTKVVVVDRKPGGWVLSRATVDVERVYHGIEPTPKRLAFYFWSSTDHDLTIAHKLAAKNRILVFLSTDLAPLKGIETDPAVKYMLQFAKANHRGYLYSIGARDTVRDAVFAQDATLEMPLAKAEQLLAARKH